MANLSITDTVTELRRLTTLNRKLSRERDEINDVAKTQRVEIRRLKKLLDEAVKMIPSGVHNDKFFEQADTATHKDEI